MNMSIFRRSRVAVESNAYRNFDHFRRSGNASVISSYRSRIAIVYHGISFLLEFYFRTNRERDTSN